MIVLMCTCTLAMIVSLPENTSLDSQSISAIPGFCDSTTCTCMVHVRWSEPYVSCGGSVSHYVLSVTPPTPDCESGSGGSGSEFMINETHYNLTVVMTETYNLNISVINSCGDRGEPAEYIIYIGGMKMCTCTAHFCLVNVPTSVITRSRMLLCYHARPLPACCTLFLCFLALPSLHISTF